MLGSTLATVPEATEDWYCKGLMTFPYLLLGTEAQEQCEHTCCYITHENLLLSTKDNAVSSITIFAFAYTYSGGW